VVLLIIASREQMRVLIHSSSMIPISTYIQNSLSKTLLLSESQLKSGTSFIPEKMARF
jgi:hypothetical protein